MDEKTDPEIIRFRRLAKATFLLLRRTGERFDIENHEPDEWEEELGMGRPPWNPDGEDGPT